MKETYRSVKLSLAEDDDVFLDVLAPRSIAVHIGP
jgi:hypothetical protein